MPSEKPNELQRTLKSLSEFKSDPAPPEHAFELTIRIGINDLDRLDECFQEISQSVKAGGLEALSTLGYRFSCRRRNVTDAQYKSELAAWSEQRRGNS